MPVEERILNEAHKRSCRNRETVEKSNQCGCFCCLAIFPASEVVEYIRGEETALCPRCHIDSVLGDASGFPIKKGFLQRMEEAWFADAKTVRFVDGHIVETEDRSI